MNCFRRHLAVVGLLGLVLLSAVKPGPAGQAPPWERTGVDRIVAIGDVHGSYDKFAALLSGTGLVDGSMKWTGGAAHLVLVGDLVDRGRDDRKVMDLVMRLQPEAKAAGGEVHALLGNHDIMVLMRDLRYVDKKGYAAFAADEKPEDREKAWAGYVTAYPADRAGDPKLRAAFDDSYPPGFFAYMRMLDLEGPYGAWALTRPAVIKVGGIVFVHGGLTEKAAAKGLDGINREVHEAILAFAKAAKALEPLIRGPATLEELSAVAYDIEKGAFKGKPDAAQAEAARALIACLDSPLLAQDSAVWYRGNALEAEGLERRRIDEVLGLLKASTLVVGHTPTAQGLVTSRFNARVFRADVGQAYGRQPYCLEFKGAEVRVFDPQTAAYGLASAEKPQGQKWTTMQPQMTDRQLEDYLRKAKIEASSDLQIDDRTVQLLELDLDGLKFRAVFLAIDQAPPAGKTAAEVRLRRYQHELAAYWIDRRLKLRMVPVTVVRAIGGRRRSLFHQMVGDGLELKAAHVFDASRGDLTPPLPRLGSVNDLIRIVPQFLLQMDLIFSPRSTLNQNACFRSVPLANVCAQIVPKNHQEYRNVSNNIELHRNLRAPKNGRFAWDFNYFLHLRIFRRFLHTVEVRGSSPLSPTTCPYFLPGPKP